MPGAESRLSLKAHAKINLALDVIGKRPDGFLVVAIFMKCVCLV